MGSLGNTVLLESAIDGIAGQSRLGAKWFVHLLAEVTGQARTVEPLSASGSQLSPLRRSRQTANLDASVVSDLDVFHKLTTGDDDTGSLMASYQGKLGFQGPVSVYGVKVSMADTGIFNVDEDFIGTGLLYGDLLVIDRSARFLNHLEFLSADTGSFYSGYTGQPMVIQT